MATTNNAINVTAQGIVGYDGAGNFVSSALTGNAVLISGNSQVISNVIAPGNIGTPLVSTGAAPAFGTCEPRGGGTGLTALVAYELLAGGTGTTNPMQQISSGTTGQVLISNGSTALSTFQTIAGTFSWIDEATSFTPAPSSGYFCTAALSVDLPALPVQGQTVTVYCDTSGSIVIVANTGQFIRNGASISASGGTATNSSQGDTMTLVYRSASSTWYSTSVEGTWLVV
jgi:hypothetical protein